jgi:hypothetical protein
LLTKLCAANKIQIKNELNYHLNWAASGTTKSGAESNIGVITQKVSLLKKKPTIGIDNLALQGDTS